MEEDVLVEDEQLEGQGASEEQEEGDFPRPLGPFMTPQPPAIRASSVLSSHSCLSVQGPQRVRVVEPWKVKDIVVPPPSTPSVKKEDPEPKEQVSEAEKSVRTFARSTSRILLIFVISTGHTSETEICIHDARSCRLTNPRLPTYVNDPTTPFCYYSLRSSICKETFHQTRPQPARKRGRNCSPSRKS